MIKNYLKTAFRNIMRNKFYSLINILGLSVGFGIFLLIFYYLKFEYNFDKHYPQANQMYRITTDMIWESGQIQRTAVSAPPTAPFLKKDYPEVLAATRFIPAYETLIETQFDDPSKPDQQYFEQIYQIDTSFFDVFQIKLIRGNTRDIFSHSRTVVLSEKMAEKYFGKEDAVGQTLKMNNHNQFIVKGIMEDLPANSHFIFDILVNNKDLPEMQSEAWRNMSAFSYVILDKNTDPAVFEAKLVAFKEKYMEAYKDLLEYRVQRMLDIHLRSSNDFELATTFDKTVLMSVAGIAILILLIAAINYMNMSIAGSMTRSKEVGLRKVSGASRGMIMSQFLIESLFVTFIALFTGIVIAEILTPLFNDFAQTGISINYLHEAPGIIAIGLVIALFSGSYPALFISRYQPEKALKGTTVSHKGGNGVRKVMVTFQFTITILLLIATGVIYQQFSFIKNKELGFRKDVKVNIYLWNDSTGRFARDLETRLKNQSGIQKVCLSDHIPGGEPWYEHFWPEGFDSHMPMRTLNISPEYMDAIGLDLLMGRNFSNDFGTDTAACILNEAAVKELGWEMDNVIGKTIKHNFSNSWEEMITAHVIGVVKDYHYQSMHQQIEPIVMTMHKTYYPIVTVVAEGENIGQLIHIMEKQYAEMQFGYPFDYSFLDKDIEEMYIIDQKIATLVFWFSGLSIFIACLGLLGLSSFSLRKRMREIGVRKVFGASVKDILVIFTREFSWLIVIASIIAIPAGWFFMDLWLQNFAYHASMSIWIFLASAIIAYIIAIATVSFQAYRFATHNPADVIRYE